jgi:hypothetical protein
MKTAEQLKLKGLEVADSKYAVDLAKAQVIAELIAMPGRPISADDVREAFRVKEGRELQIGNAIGWLFKNTKKKKWQFAGFVRSKRPESHARTLRTWVLAKKPEQYRYPATPPDVGIENGVRFCGKCGLESCEGHDFEG